MVEKGSSIFSGISNSPKANQDKIYTFSFLLSLSFVAIKVQFDIEIQTRLLLSEILFIIGLSLIWSFNFFQVFVVYFFAGIKKLDRDWWTGYSMVGLSRHWTFEPFRLFMSDDQIDFFVVHLCGLILDLTAGFLMYFDKTRWLGKYISRFILLSFIRVRTLQIMKIIFLRLHFFCSCNWEQQNSDFSVKLLTLTKKL